MFDLKKPCRDCPFRKGQGERYRLRPDRLAEIRTAQAFQCHKTLERTPGSHEPQQCAGLMSVLHKEGTPNTIMQVAERISDFDAKKIDGSETYDTWEEVVAAHSAEKV